MTSPDPSELPFDLPGVVERTAQPYAAIQRRVTMAEMGHILPPLHDQVVAWLAAQGAEPVGPPFWRYRVIDMATTLQIDVGFPTAGVLAGDHDVLTGELPAGRYAALRHHGHPDSLRQATGELLEWAESEGLVFDQQPTPDGDAWACRLESYLSDPAEVPDLNDWITDLAFKLSD